MNLYQETGYISIENILAKGYPFNFITGGRGTGKTYTALKYVVETGKKFILLRRTQQQCDIINTPEFNIFRPLNLGEGWNIGSKKISKQNAAFYRMEEVEGKEVASGSPLGYTAALSTLSNMRGFDASDVELLIYDEFCPEKHERIMKNEADAFFNAIETINRNRELTGHKPITCLCLANSNDLANPLYVALGILSTVDSMRRKGREIYENRERGLLVISLKNSPISERKNATALYKLTSGSEFADMAINNEFAQNVPSKIRHIPLAECKPIVTVGEITIYRHKSTRTLYVSTHKSGACPEYGKDDTSLKRFIRAFGWIWQYYLDNKIYFEEYACEILLTKYIG